MVMVHGCTHNRVRGISCLLQIEVSDCSESSPDSRDTVRVSEEPCEIPRTPLQMEEQVNPLERDHTLAVVLPGGLEKNTIVHGR